MKYRGKKALMKCCKSCQNKKGIKCLGEPKIFKYQGYKFCIECTRSEKDIQKSFNSLKARISLNKRTNYYESKITKEIMTTQSDSLPQRTFPQIDIEEIEKINTALDRLKERLLEATSKIINALKLVVNSYGKSKEV